MTESDKAALGHPHGESENQPVIGLALSGGGVRATLFSLGVAVAFVETGANRWVRSIASVSGGSLLNAWLAHASDFSEEQPAHFAPRAGKLAKMLSDGGVFFLSGANLWKLVLAFVGRIPTLIGIIFGIGLVVASFIQENQEIARKIVHGLTAGLGTVYNLLPHLAWLYFVISILLVVALTLRGRWQESIFGVRLGELTGDNKSKCTDFAESKVQHVLVSTDLKSGYPVFFSKDFVHCYVHGWSEPGKHLQTATVLYASAAFPVVYPPRRLKMRKFSFRSGKPGPLSDLALSDGGVYNNLGDDWFNVRDGQYKKLWPYGGLDLDAPSPLNTRIVVNAGAPSEAIKRLYVGRKVLRTMSVLYDNTVKPRVQQIRQRCGMLLDIKESPLEFAKQLADEKRWQDEAKPEQEGAKERQNKANRAAQIRAQLDKRDDEFWAELTRETAGTATKLSGAGRRTAAALMHHGYLSAMVLLWANYGESLPHFSELRAQSTTWPRDRADPFPLKDEKYFLDLASGSDPHPSFEHQERAGQPPTAPR